MNRRQFLQTSLAALVAADTRAGEPAYPAVLPGRRLAFPRDHGAHPAYRTEWWYITGWLDGGPRRTARGFQVTFFRNRPGVAEESRSRFAPRQLLFAHAAIAVPAAGRLVHDQRAARAGFGLVETSEEDTDVRIGDWSLARRSGAYHAVVAADEFRMTLEIRPTQPILLQGDGGYSRKGPAAVQASYYYSRPHLAVSGFLEHGGARDAVTGRAWLDHEWASEPLASEAAGWDWVGLNGDDGSALTAFRIRHRDGTPFWAGGSYRDAAGRVTVFRPRDVAFEPLRTWRSPRTGVSYPVGMTLRAGSIGVELEPLMDDQELDARASTATIYWEGAVTARSNGRPFGRGYLELTGYWQPLKL